MAQEDFDHLIDGICNAKGITRPKERHAPFHLRVNGVAFSLLPGGTYTRSESFVFVCDFGPPPAEKRVEALEALLETNIYLFGTDTPRFGLNPETGNILYLGGVPFAQATTQSVLDMMDQLSEQALLFAEMRQRESTDSPTRTLTPPWNPAGSASARIRSATPRHQ